MTEAKGECIHTILFGKLDGKRLPGRHSRRREVILKSHSETVCMCVDRIQLFEYSPDAGSGVKSNKSFLFYNKRRNI